MSAFSRGLLGPQRILCNVHLRPVTIRRPLQPIFRSRFFGVPGPLRASTQAAPKASRTAASPSRFTISRIPPAQLQPAPSSYAFLQQLAKKGVPTLLYEAPSHAWMMVSAWTTAVFCSVYAVYNASTYYLFPPEGLSWWVSPAYGVICAFMGGMGTYFLIGAFGIIKSVRAIPLSTTRAAKSPSAISRIPQINLEFQIKRPLPGVRPKTITVPASDVKLPTKLYQPVLYLSEAKQRELRRVEERRKEEQWQQDKERLLTMPFRQGARGVKGAWQGVKRALTRDGFAKVYIKGNTYKLDITGGWALEDGKAIDRIVKASSSE